VEWLFSYLMGWKENTFTTDLPAVRLAVKKAFKSHNKVVMQIEFKETDYQIGLIQFIENYNAEN
jgi:hypothetical protein